MPPKNPLQTLREFFSSSKALHDPRVVDSAVKGDRESLARLAQEQGSAANPASVLSSAVNAPLSRRSFLRGAASATASNLVDSTALKHIQLPKFDVYPPLDVQFYNQLAEHAASVIAKSDPRSFFHNIDQRTAGATLHDDFGLGSYARHLASSPQFRGDSSLVKNADNMSLNVSRLLSGIDDLGHEMPEVLMGHPDYKSALLSVASPDVPDRAVNRVINSPVFGKKLWKDLTGGQMDDVLADLLSEFSSRGEALDGGVNPSIVRRMKGMWEPESVPENVGDKMNIPQHGPKVRYSISSDGSMTSIEPAAPELPRLRDQRFARGGLARCRNAS